MQWQCELCEFQTDSKESWAGHRSGHVRRGELPRTEIRRMSRTCQCGLTFLNAALRAGHERLMHRPWCEIRSPGAQRIRLTNELMLSGGRRCEICSNTSWMGQPIPLEIDHIDGNPENSARENFRLVCPNCHAQTPTYRGRNIGKVENSKRKQVLKKHYGKYR